MKAYEDGKLAYDSGDYDEALQLFLEAQSLYPSPVFHYNIGLCHESLENYEQAIVSYKAYLRSYKSAFGEDPEDKVNTENKIERIEERMEAKQAEEEAAAAEAAKPRVIIQPPPDTGEDEPPPGRGLIITGGVLAGLGVGVAAAGGTVFGLQAAESSDQIDAIYNGGNPERVSLDEARDIDAAGTAAQRNQIIMISVGSALAVTGVALLAVGLVKKKKGAGVTDVAPSAGPEGAGLFIRGRF